MFSAPSHRLLFPACFYQPLQVAQPFPLEEASSLASYDGLTPNKGRITKAKYKVTPSDLVATKTIFIEPTVMSAKAAQSIKKPSDQGAGHQCDQSRPLCRR